MTLWTFDTEDDSKGNVWLIDFYDGEKHYTFHKDKDPDFRSKAIQFLTQIDNAEFWSCNLQYDLVNVFKDEISLIRMTFIGSRIITGNWEGITFKDTLNHWKISVQKMGEKINLPKLDPGKDFNNPKYCQRDAEIVHVFVNAMKERYEKFGAKLKPTIGSTALDLFEKRYFRKVRKSPFKTSELEFMRSGYYGGRTEIFFNKMVEGTIFYSDFNSLYPSCMRGYFPVIYERNFQKLKSRRREDFEKHDFGFVDATVETPEQMEIPYLPWRDPGTGRLLFPLGRFRGVWTKFELFQARKHGYRIEKIHRAMYLISSKQTIFNNFVNDLYNERMKAKDEKDELTTDALKRIMNNLYGKFGQGREITKMIPFKNKKQLKNGDLLIGDLILRNEVSKTFPEHTNFIWSAMVTAIGRDKLWEAMNEIRIRGGRVIYCDTDSVIYEHEANLFRDNGDLGGLKLEGVFRRAWFKLPKQYFLEEYTGKRNYKTKGVPKFHAEEFFETGRARFQKPYKLKEALRRSIAKNPKKRIQANVWDYIEKTSYQKYDKREVLKDGSTRAIRIG